MPRATVPNYISGKAGNYKLTLPVASFVLPDYQGKVFPLTMELLTALPSMLDENAAGYNAFMLAIEAVNQEQLIAERESTTTTTSTTDGEVPEFVLNVPPEEPTKVEDPAVTQAKGFYLTLWGISPPKGYVEQFFKAGGDVFDFQRQELSRPGAESKPYFRDNAVGFATTLSDIFGRGF